MIFAFPIRNGNAKKVSLFSRVSAFILDGKQIYTTWKNRINIIMVFKMYMPEIYVKKVMA